MLLAIGRRWMDAAPRRLALACAAGVFAAALACSRPATPPARATTRDAVAPVAPSSTQVANGGPPAGSSPEPPPATAAGADATLPAPGPVPAPLTAAGAVVGGEERPLALDALTSVDPRSSFRLEVAAHLTDGRLALLDEQDAMVACSGTAEMGAASTRYQLTPDEPLSPGASYTLRLDGSASRDAHDPAGRAFTPVRLQLRVEGERPPAPAVKRHRSRRR